MKLSVIIPMYNEKDMEQRLRKAVTIFDDLDFSYEIIVVDDGSQNSCYDEAKEVPSRKIRVFRYEPNQGKGGALKYGFHFATGQYVAFIDADLETNPRYLREFFAIMEREQADVVIGSKRHPLSKVQYPFFRRVMSRTYQWLVKLLFHLDVKDTQVGLKLFKSQVLKDAFPHMRVKRFAFDIELLVLAHVLGYKIVEAPIESRYKFETTISPRQIFYMLVDTMMIFYRMKIRRDYGQI